MSPTIRPYDCSQGVEWLTYNITQKSCAKHNLSSDILMSFTTIPFHLRMRQLKDMTHTPELICNDSYLPWTIGLSVSHRMIQPKTCLTTILMVDGGLEKLPCPLGQIYNDLSPPQIIDCHVTRFSPFFLVVVLALFTILPYSSIHSFIHLFLHVWLLSCKLYCGAQGSVVRPPPCPCLPCCYLDMLPSLPIC